MMSSDSTNLSVYFGPNQSKNRRTMSEVQVVKEEPTSHHHPHSHPHALHHHHHHGDKHSLHSAMPIAAPLSLVHPNALPSVPHSSNPNPFGPSYSKQSMNPFPAPFGSNGSHHAMHSFSTQPAHPFNGYPSTNQSLNGHSLFPPVPFPANPPDPGRTPYSVPNPMFYAPVHYNGMQYGHNAVNAMNGSLLNSNGVHENGVDDNEKLCVSEEQQTDDDSKQSGDSKNSKPYSLGNGHGMQSSMAYYLIPLNTPNGHSSAYMPLINGSSVTDNDNDQMDHDASLQSNEFNNGSSHNASPPSPPRPSSSESELTNQQLHHDAILDSNYSLNGISISNGIAEGQSNVMDHNPMQQNGGSPLMNGQQATPHSMYNYQHQPSLSQSNLSQAQPQSHSHSLSQSQPQHHHHHHHAAPYFNVNVNQNMNSNVHIPSTHIHHHLPFAVPTPNGVESHPFPPPPVLPYSDLGHGHQPSFSLAPIDPTQPTEPPLDEKHILEDKKDILLNDDTHCNVPPPPPPAPQPILESNNNMNPDPAPVAGPNLTADLNQHEAVVPTHAPSFMLQPPTSIPTHHLGINTQLTFPPMPTANLLEHSATVDHSSTSFDAPILGDTTIATPTQTQPTPPQLTTTTELDSKPLVPAEMPRIEEDQSEDVLHTNNHQCTDTAMSLPSPSLSLSSSTMKPKRGRSKPHKKGDKSPKKIPKKTRKQSNKKKIRGSIILPQRSSSALNKKQDISVNVPALNKMGISPNKLQNTAMKGRKMTRNRRRSASNRVIGKTKSNSNIPILGEMRVSRKTNNSSGGGHKGDISIPPALSTKNNVQHEGEMEVAYSQQYPQVGFPYTFNAANEEGKKFTCKFMDSSSSDNGPGFCDRQFGQKCHWMRHCLEKHVPTEMSQRYQCRYCNMKYAQNSSLKEHVAICHSNKPPSFKCPYCSGDITFTRWTSVLRHCRNQHPNQEEPKKQCRPRISPKGKTAAMRKKRKTVKTPRKKRKTATKQTGVTTASPQKSNSRSNSMTNRMSITPVVRRRNGNTNNNGHGHSAMDVDHSPSTLPLPPNILPHVNVNISMNQMLSSNHHSTPISNAAMLPNGHRNIHHAIHHG